MTSLQCPIDQEPLTSSDHVVSTPCGHVFHERCIAKWLRSHDSCPQCRKAVSQKALLRLNLGVSTSEVRRLRRVNAELEQSERLGPASLSPETQRLLDSTELALTEERDRHQTTTRELDGLKTCLRQTSKELQTERAKTALLKDQLLTARRRISLEKRNARAALSRTGSRTESNGALELESDSESSLKDQDPSWYSQVTYLLLTIGVLLLISRIDRLISFER